MGCVNKSSKEFKDLASRHDLDANALELITHKYWLETGNEDSFPTDVYVQAQLDNGQYEEPSASVRKLWKKKYAHSKEFQSIPAMQAAYREASKFFPASAISYYKNAKGNFVLSIKQPVKAFKPSKTQFFKDYDRAVSPRKLDLGVETNQPYGIYMMQNLYKRFNTDRTSRDLANKVFSLAKELNLDVTFVSDDKLPEGILGRYKSQEGIFYRKSFFENSSLNDRKAAILLHEAIHAITMYALSDQTAGWKRHKDLELFRTEISSLYQELKDNPILKGERGTTNVKEFVAELANPAFRAKLQEIDKASQSKKSIWQRLLNAFKALLGIRPSDTYYTRSMAALDKAISAFDVDTYMRYTGIKNSFRTTAVNISVNHNNLRQDITAAFDSKLYDEEMQQIKRDAIVNGTFMKAPNGNPTNLNERQWLQVRTKNFKDWFGDWENPTIFTANNVDNPTELRKKYPSTLPNKYYHHSTNKFGKQAFNTKEGSKSRLHIVGRLTTDKVDVLVVENPNSSNPIAHITLATADNVKPVESNFELQEHQDKVIPLDDYVDTTFRNNLDRNVSKVVDENGEPLVVYHFTNEKDIPVFSSDREAYFTSDPEGTDIYEPYENYNENKIAVFLSIKKPVYTKGTGGYLYDKNKSILTPRTSDYTHLDRDAQIRTIQEIKNNFNNVDGIIRDFAHLFNDDFGTKMKDKVNTEYITFYPNQIKSADHNTGEFSPYNNEIADYEIDNSNVNGKLSDENKKEILREVRKINRAKRSLIDTGGDFLYIVDHTDRDGLEHLKGGQEGFLCKKIIDVRGLSKVQIDNIKKHYDTDKGSNEATRGFEHWLEGNGYRERLINSDSLVIEDRKTTSHNVGLDSQEQGQTSLGGRGSGLLQENFPIHEVKTGYDGTNHPRYMEATKGFIDSLSDEALGDELSLIQQESADYDIAFAIEDKGSKENKAVPRDFTFNDGVTVKAPFRPNVQQIDALNAMSDFIKSKETSMTLSGYAGTGKTSLMEMIAQKCKKQHKDVVFCASTNKAAAVLGERVSKADFKAFTLNKVFGIEVEIDTKAKSYDARNLVNVLKDSNLDFGSIVIIDEASMIGEDNYKVLNNIAKVKGLKLIYVGDEAQLAPVGEEQVSKVFRNSDGRVVGLTQVERTGDNAILREATDLRNGRPLSGISSFNSKGEGIAYVSPKNEKTIDEVIRTYVKGLEKDPNYFRILAYTNKAVADYNDRVRRQLGYTSAIPHVDEPMTGYNNWGYDYHTKSYRFINSESYKVTGIGQPKSVSIALDNGSKAVMLATPLTLEDSTGHTDTIDFMDIKDNPQNRQVAIVLAREKQGLFNKAKRMQGKEAKAKIYQQINAIDKFLFVNDNIVDDKGNYLQTKTIDFGYALTVHKSQGSTFTNVLLDDVDIAKATPQSKITESFDLGEDNIQDGSDAIMNDAEDVDLGDLTSAIVEPKQNNKVADLRQQLEYVGVSRATDTVTIISNNVKKEGSPLHPENNRDENNEGNDKINPSDSRSSNGVTAQLVNHLKSMGINVLGRDAMREFLNAHPNVLVQMSRTFGFEIPYENSKFRKQIPEILEIVKANKYDKAGTDAVTLGSESHKTIYLIDHSANKELADNLKEGDGFGIRGVFNVNNLSKDDCRTIIRNIASDYGGSEVYLRRKLQNLGITSKHLSGIDIAAELKMGIAADDSLVSPREREGFPSDNNRSGSDGREGKAGSRQEDRVGNDGVEFFTTSEGEVYGFVDKEGNIYLDETKISPNHPIHEYTHLWDRAVAKHNPELWQRGIELMRQTSMWDRIASNEHYGKRWQAIKGMTQERLSNLIASEVHARFTGEGGEALLDNLAKEKGQAGIIAKLKQWILDVWRDLKATFVPWSKEDLDSLTLKDFNHMTVRDFAEGINPLSVEADSSTEEEYLDVSLPNYERIQNLYSGDVTVDAKWKIPYLKELDSQLSASHSEEENQNIINQMNKVTQATNEEEYLQEAKDSSKKKVDIALDEYEKLNQQIDNLLEGGGEDYKELNIVLSASEVRHAAEQIANAISDEITKFQTEEGYAQKAFPSLNTKLDFSTATRKQIVEAVGINSLVNKVKLLFDTEKTYYEYLDASCQADLIFDNWDAMILLGADTFAFNEGFGISRNYSKGNFETTNKSTIDYDNLNDYSNDVDIAAEEGEKDEQEHWQVESRTIDVLNSMSALVRQGIHECFLLNADGSKVISKWSIAERVNPRKAVNSLLRWTQGAMSLDDMVKRLADKQKQNPWLSQLVERLSDRSGKQTDFQSQFYGVFQKHFQLYSVVLQENGKYHGVYVNSHPALFDAMRTITTQFKIGELSLFNAGRDNLVNARLLGSDETVGKNYAFNLHKALHELRSIVKAIDGGKTLDDGMVNVVAANIMGVCRTFGYAVTEDMLTDVLNAENIKKAEMYLGFMVRSLDAALDAQLKGKLKNYNPFAFGTQFGIDGSLRNFLTPITDRLEDTAVSAFYDSGKMYQSYVIPSFMTKLMNKFHQKGQDLENFLWDEYGSSEWFAFDKFGSFDRLQWRNEWLRLLARDADARKVFDHKVELNFNKHNYMRNMSDAEYTLSLIAEYFSESIKMDNMVPAWFRVPMQSNKPSSEFIKFYSYRGQGYKSEIVHHLHNMFLQELSRIQTVRMRNYTKKDPQFIKNFDTNGHKFCFLPIFNAYLENTPEAKTKRQMLHNTVEYDADRLAELQQKYDAWTKGDILGTFEDEVEYTQLKTKKEVNERSLTSDDDGRLASLLQKKIEGRTRLSAEEEVALSKLVDKVILQFMENRVQSILSVWEDNGILASAQNIEGIYPSELKNEDAARWTKQMVENFLWNDAFASKNILQITIGDIAFYKDTEDLQKRLAQLHAPGMRGNIYALDYNGNRVSDGKYRTSILSDFDTFKSNIIANISEVFDRKIREARRTGKSTVLLEALKDSLVGKDGKYTKINVTDAQGYSSPSSYRKKAFIFGRWSRHAEDIYQKLLRGDYTYTDLETAFQPLKPFVYSKLTKDMGVDDAPIHSMQVPFQAKNAEYLLIMADALLQGEKLSRPNLLRAVYRVMEDSERINPTKGIDTVQFESAIKSGLQGKMDIAQFLDMPDGEDAAYAYMMDCIYKKQTDNAGNRIYREYNTDVFVHETSYDDYCLQQEVPEHFKEHSQAHGSQIRMIIPSDLDLYTTDENGNQVDNYYEWTEPDGTVKRLKAGEFRKEYEQTIADNIEDSINNLVAELHLGSEDRRERNIALSKILQREVLSSPRYGVDLIQACSIDKQTGEFRIPKGDPIQAKRIEQLINSVIKNRVNKQKIAGGPIVQVSNFGTSRQLHIRFNDHKGNLLPLESEYDASRHDGLSYKEFIKKNQGGIAYFEVFAPIWSNELFNKFSNPDGTINVEAIEATDPELLKMVSYRIPTEDKYSCAPMKVVGFMPREAGDAIMLPYELTEIDDSDFDVDKRYVMRKDIPIEEKKVGDYIDALVERGKMLYKETMGSDASAGSVLVGDEGTYGYVEKMVDSLVTNPKKFPKDSPFRKALYSEYQKLAYCTNAPTSGRQYRDNKIVDMTYAVLTNPMTADKILNPGGFDAPKRMGYMVAAYKNPANNKSWAELGKLSIDELKDLSYTDKDLTFADIQVQFYKQNAAAASLIGVFAVNKVAHAVLESNGIYIDISEICGETPFHIADMAFGGKMEIDATYDRNGNFIGKTLGSLVSASADAVKDPILNLMNVNMSTAGMLNTMLRLGMPFDDAALFLSQDIIERLLSQFNRENLNNYVSLDSLVSQWLDKYAEKHGISEASNINSEPLTREELVEGLTASDHEAIDYKVLLAFQKMRSIVAVMRKPTFATRFNSISSAVGPLIVDNLIMEHKMQEFTAADAEDSTGLYSYDSSFGDWIPVDIDDIFADHPILRQFARTVDIAKVLFSDMPAGSTGFRNLLAKLPADIADKVYGDKKLLDQFSSFYQSYLLIQSGVVNPQQLKQYVSGFAQWFFKQDFKAKYPDNALIQAIRMNVSKSSKTPYLLINITGMDEQQKEELRSAWIDLHKADPELSKMLFNYCFFRAGIGFSPKTFMSLVPTYVKERIGSKDGSASYVDTYRRFPEVVDSLVIDQFIRNNWQDTRLVPWRGGKDTHYDVDVPHGRLTVYRKEEIAALNDVSYMKTKLNNNAYLWHQVTNTPDSLVYELVKPLGNNGEYLEIDVKNITSPISETSKVAENNEASDLRTMGSQEHSAVESSKPVVSEAEVARNLDIVAGLIQKQVPSLSKEEAMDRATKIKENPNSYGRFLQNVFKHIGLELNKEEAVREFKKYC